MDVNLYNDICVRTHAQKYPYACIYANTCKYVCMYVRRYACMYACMCVKYIYIETHSHILYAHRRTEPLVQWVFGVIFVCRFSIPFSGLRYDDAHTHVMLVSRRLLKSTTVEVWQVGQRTRQMLFSHQQEPRSIPKGLWKRASTSLELHFAMLLVKKFFHRSLECRLVMC